MPVHSPQFPCPPAFVLAALAAASLGACADQAPLPPVEELYYARNEVPLLSGLERAAPVQALLDFDTEARVLATHRSYVLIRTADQQEGWVRRSLLLDAAARRHLRTLTRQSLSVPSQGQAHARDTLNVHVEPYRWAPTFYQLDKDEAFELLDRMLVDRLPAAAAAAGVVPASLSVDHWYLVRVPGIQQAGWLLENMIYAGIPLEVAMLAQGKPIIAYVPLGSVQDESLGESKTTWLWFQATEEDQIHDFDRLMVFQWDPRRDRYIVIREHTGLIGYLPVETLPDLETRHGVGTGFRILLDKDGQLHTRTYAYVGKRVHVLDEEPLRGLPRVRPPGGFNQKYSR